MTHADTPKMRNLSSFTSGGGRGTSSLHSPKPHGACSATDNAETKTTTAAAVADIKHRTLMASLRLLAVAAAHMRALAMEWILRQLRSPKMSLQRLAVVAAQMHALAIDMEWLVRLLLGLKTSPERLAIEAAWKRLLKVWFGDGTIMGPCPPSGSATNGEPNIFDDLAGAESVGADAHVVLKALDKLVDKMEKISRDDRDWNVKQLKSYHIGMSIRASKLIEIVRSKGNLTWEEVFLKAYNELTGEETKLWVQEWIREQRTRRRRLRRTC
ncbi:hypothetical protein E2562_007434 [Oryza meyeriana var. granulata]|uniref:Uncharacterized protein n=1 Tax=Oryza meyeriana var. granulata TaxID=110450 RepID=A0A6G1CZS9_9ORYZ|nr:hypothetical protein E2562_007434 [Oryza meyeriana var. granulata]